MKARANYRRLTAFSFAAFDWKLDFCLLSHVVKWLFNVNPPPGGTWGQLAALQRLGVVCGVTIFGVSERANRLEQSKVWMSLNIATFISATRLSSFPIMSEGSFNIKQKCLTSGKLIAFKADSNLTSPTQREDSMSRRLRSESSKERKRGGEKMKGNNQNEIKCWTTSWASTSVASVSDVVN